MSTESVVPVGASLPGAAPRSPHEAEQLARLKARDLDGFVAVLLKSVHLYADTEAGRQGMGSPVMAALVYAGIERDIALLAGAALEAGPNDQSGGEYCNSCGKPAFRCVCGETGSLPRAPDWRTAALKCIVPMEALHADNLDGSQLIAPRLRVYIADAVAALREAVSLEGGVRGESLPEPSQAAIVAAHEAFWQGHIDQAPQHWEAIMREALAAAYRIDFGMRVETKPLPSDVIALAEAYIASGVLEHSNKMNHPIAVRAFAAWARGQLEVRERGWDSARARGLRREPGSPPEKFAPRHSGNAVGGPSRREEP